MRQYFRKKIELVSTGAASESLYDIIVDSGLIYIYTHISVENLTSAYSKLRIGVDSVSEFQQHEEEISPAAGRVYWTKSDIYVFPVERLQVVVSGCSAGDKLEVLAQGYIEKAEKLNA